jgi:hypothetical protein
MGKNNMTGKHPLKRKSVKPSISTVRGMLPAKQFRMLDAAMQSLRTAGARLEWIWKNPEVGWVCAGIFDELNLCELRPTDEPLIGIINLTDVEVAKVKAAAGFPKNYKAILDVPIEKKKGSSVFEFPLEESKMRDFFSNFVEELHSALATPTA